MMPSGKRAGTQFMVLHIMKILMDIGFQMTMINLPLIYLINSSWAWAIPFFMEEASDTKTSA